MAARLQRTIEPMTLGNMRANGVRLRDVSCWLCHQWAIMCADDVPVPTFGPRMLRPAGADGGVEMASGPRPEPSEPIKRLAASGLLPPDLASKFPKGQVAALAIISIEARGGGGICDLRIDEIATRSATGPSTVQSALKTAKQLGLLTVEVRHRLPNLIRIVSPDWLAWLKKGYQGEATPK
jgi:hypothetical protein